MPYRHGAAVIHSYVLWHALHTLTSKHPSKKKKKKWVIKREKVDRAQLWIEEPDGKERRPTTLMSFNPIIT